MLASFPGSFPSLAVPAGPYSKLDFRISDWISEFHNGFVDFNWISRFQIGLLLTLYEISFVTDPSSFTDTLSSIFVILKFKHTRLKFSVYGRKQTDRQTGRQADIHTHVHVRNAVTLVWGLLRLAPTKPWNMSSWKLRKAAELS